MNRKSFLGILSAFLVGCVRPPSLSEDQYVVEHDHIRMRRELAKFATNYGYSTCDSCKLPWWVVEGHSVLYVGSELEGVGMGCFPICEMCWKTLGPEEAWPFYQAHIRKNYPGDTEKEETLKSNVFGAGRGYLQPSPIKPEKKEQKRQTKPTGTLS